MAGVHQPWQAAGATAKRGDEWPTWVQLGSDSLGSTSRHWLAGRPPGTCRVASNQHDAPEGDRFWNCL
jgi:hypothetical protein